MKTTPTSLGNPIGKGRNDGIHEGITPLQWFAGLSLQAILDKQPSLPDSPAEREELALWAYRMGQAMLAMEKQLG